MHLAKDGLLYWLLQCVKLSWFIWDYNDPREPHRTSSFEG